MPAPVTFDRRVDPALQLVADRAAAAGTDIASAVRLIAELPEVPEPAIGSTSARLELLATLGAADLTAARVVEPHLDALAILAEATAAGISVDLAGAGIADSATWGVFAAEGPGLRLEARPGAGGWLLTGTKPWCSLAGVLDAALVTAHTDAGRRLFAVDLRDKGIRAHSDAWHARGLPTVTSGPVDFDAVPAVPVGEAGWYLHRPGFAWGGIGVAAVWWGAAVALGRSLYQRGLTTSDQQILLMQLGAVDTALQAGAEALAAAARSIDTAATQDGTGAVVHPQVLASRVRCVVHDAAETVLSRVGHALGPAPLALDAAHAGRVADLTLYLRQHHAERDQASLGALLVGAGTAPW